jgi:hypothetical protein
MKLKVLREHYQSTNNQVWKPKKSYKNREQIRQELGFDPLNIYSCSICNNLHTSTYRDTNRNYLT